MKDRRKGRNDERLGEFGRVICEQARQGGRNVCERRTAGPLTMVQQCNTEASCCPENRTEGCRITWDRRAVLRSAGHTIMEEAQPWGKHAMGGRGTGF